MNYVHDRVPNVVLAALLLGGVAVAQLKLSIPSSRFAVDEKIEAKVANTSKTPISYCMEYGQRSPLAGSTQRTPMPFFVEQRRRGVWQVLLIGPDVGSMRAPEALDSGASVAFPFRLNETGEMRLSLYYWVGERKDACDESAKGRKTAKSHAFTIIEDSDR